MATKLKDMLDNNRRCLAQLVKHRFYVDIAAGQLSYSCLARYLAQDNIYLQTFAFVLECLSCAITNSFSAQILASHRLDTLNTIAQQQTFVREVLKRSKTLREKARPTTYAYANHLRVSLIRSPVEGLTSLLPCYFFYRKAVALLKRRGSEDPIFSAWIGSLPDDKTNLFWIDEISEVFDRMHGAKHSQANVESAFAVSSSYEVMFLEMAVEDERWK
jgi:thiaminase